MISERDREIIVQCARKYGVSSIHLFGSSLYEEDANDIDIGVKGISPKIFFKFYGELLRSLSKSIDVIDLSEDSLFAQVVEKKGVKIYG